MLSYTKVGLGQLVCTWPFSKTINMAIDLVTIKCQLFAGKWMELENIILSEVSLAQKTKNRMFSLICGH
jgi:hypothetical protein